MAVEQINLTQLLSLYAADLAVVFAKAPQSVADQMVDDFAAVIKEQADALREGRAEPRPVSPVAPI